MRIGLKEVQRPLSGRRCIIKLTLAQLSLSNVNVVQLSHVKLVTTCNHIIDEGIKKSMAGWSIPRYAVCKFLGAEELWP